MSKPDPKKVRDWPRVGARIDPDIEKAFQQALEKNNESQSKVIRRMVRRYTKED